MLSINIYLASRKFVNKRHTHTDFAETEIITIQTHSLFSYHLCVLSYFQRLKRKMRKGAGEGTQHGKFIKCRYNSRSGGIKDKGEAIQTHDIIELMRTCHNTTNFLRLPKTLSSDDDTKRTDTLLICGLTR